MARRIAALLLCVLCLCMLTGCHEDGSAVPAATQAAREELVIYVWDDDAPTLTALADAFMADNADVSVRVNVETTQEYAQGLSIALNSDAQIDAFCLQRPSAIVKYFTKGQIRALDEWMRSDAMDTSGFASIYDSMKIAGSTYALPYRDSAWVVYYNKKIFDEAGMAYPTGNWTWEDYADTAQRLSRTVDGRTVYGSMSFDMGYQWWRVPARTAGAEHPMVARELEYLKQAAAWCWDLTYARNAQKPYTALADVYAMQYVQRFLQGDTAMFFCGEWCLLELNEKIGDAGFAYDIAPLPSWEGQEAYNIGSPAVVVMTEKCERPELVYRFIEYICGEQGARVVAEHSLLPAWRSEETEQIFLSSLAMPEHSTYFFQTAPRSVVPTDALYDESMEIVHAYVTKYFMREIGLEDAFAQIDAELAALRAASGE